MLDAVKRQKYGHKHSLCILTYGMGSGLGRRGNHEMQRNASNSSMGSRCPQHQLFRDVFVSSVDMGMGL